MSDTVEFYPGRLFKQGRLFKKGRRLFDKVYVMASPEKSCHELSI